MVEELIKESLKTKKHKDIPVAAIIVKDGKIISKAHNDRIKNNLTINHA